LGHTGVFIIWDIQGFLLLGTYRGFYYWGHTGDFIIRNIPSYISCLGKYRSFHDEKRDIRRGVGVFLDDYV